MLLQGILWFYYGTTMFFCLFFERNFYVLAKITNKMDQKHHAVTMVFQMCTILISRYL